MAESLGAAVLTVSVDDAQLKAGLQAAERQAKSTGQNIEQAFTKSGKPLQTAANGLQFYIDAQGRAREASGKFLSLAQQQAAGLDKLGGSAKGASESFGGLSSSLGFLAGSITAGAVLAFAQNVSQVGTAAESARVRLTALAGRFDETAQVQNLVAASARTLNLSTTEASNGFAQLFGALRPAGVSLDQINTIFVGLTATAKNFGIGGEAVSSVLVQLTQGLASGRLQGDELRSVLEQLPPLSQALAAQLGTTVGNLKKFGEEGKITSDVIIKALETLKTTELGNIDAALNSTAERLKSAQVSFEEFKVGLATTFGDLGNSLIVGFKSFFDFINRLDLSEGERQVQQLEQQISDTQDLIAQSKAYNLDTTDAESRLGDLEKRLNNIKSRPDIAKPENQKNFDQRQQLFQQINSQEQDPFGFGASGLRLGPTDFSGRALLAGFEQSIQQSKSKFGELNAQIATLQQEKIDLPIDATLDRQRIDEQLSKLRDQLAADKESFRIELQIKASEQSLADVRKQLAADPANVNLATERDQLVLQIEQLKDKLSQSGQQLVASGVQVGNEIANGAEKASKSLASAAQRFIDAAKALQSTNESNFRFLTKAAQRQTIDNAKLDIQRGVNSGYIDPKFLNARRPDDVFAAASASRSQVDALQSFNQAAADYSNAITQSNQTLSSVSNQLPEVANKIVALQGSLEGLAQKEWSVNVNVTGDSAANVRVD